MYTCEHNKNSDLLSFGNHKPVTRKHLNESVIYVIYVLCQFMTSVQGVCGEWDAGQYELHSLDNWILFSEMGDSRVHWIGEWIHTD